jgi:hypothetical protein
MPREGDNQSPTVPYVCSGCESETAVPIDDVAAAIERHNQQLHDGNSVAQVDPAIKDELASLVAKDLGLIDAND